MRDTFNIEALRDRAKQGEFEFHGLKNMATQALKVAHDRIRRGNLTRAAALAQLAIDLIQMANGTATGSEAASS